MDNDILLVTNYFPPEKGAAANRIFSLAQSLGKIGYNVKVVCPLPNYPSGEIFEKFRGYLSTIEVTSFGKISRIWIWPSNSANKLLRLLSMISFSLSLIFFFIFIKTPKKIFVQYSPVFVGFTAVFLGRLFSKKIILNVSDLWPLAGLEMGLLKKGWYYTLLLKMERFCYRHSHLIVGQSEEILEHISIFEKDKNKFLYRNIPDFSPEIISGNNTSEEIKIVYAGLLGVAQGLHEICTNISFPKNVSFHIYGAGPESEKIKDLKKTNVYFHGSLDRDILHKKMRDYDVAFIPLKNRIYGSVPSKIFEFTRLGLPVLYFAGGEGGEIVEKNCLGWVIPVSDFVAMQRYIDLLSRPVLESFNKKEIQEKSILIFDFDSQFSGFLKKLAQV